MILHQQPGRIRVPRLDRLQDTAEILIVPFHQPALVREKAFEVRRDILVSGLIGPAAEDAWLALTSPRGSEDRPTVSLS